MITLPTSYPCVTFDVLAAGSAWTFASRNRKHDRPVRVRSRLSVSTAEAAIDAAVAGAGLTHVLSYQVARLVRQGKLRIGLEAVESDLISGQPPACGPGISPAEIAPLSRIRR